MLTPQDIREKSFEKAVFGGYDMGGVDEFLDQAANDVAALQKENNVLKSKLKVLAEKIEEYRATEDAMRLALLSAQKLSVDIENEAKAKAESIVSDAQTQAKNITAAAGAEAERTVREAKAASSAERARYEEIKSSSARLIDDVRVLCTRQVSYLDTLREGANELKTEPAATPAIDDAVKKIEDSVAKLVDDEPAADVISTITVDEPTQVFSVAKESEPAKAVYSFEDLR